MSSDIQFQYYISTMKMGLKDMRDIKTASIVTQTHLLASAALTVYSLLILYNNKMHKQKSQPFHVKRVRLRRSIIKTNQILSTISISEANKHCKKLTLLSDKFISSLNSQELEVSEVKKILKGDKQSIEESSFYQNNNPRVNQFDSAKIKRIIKACQQKHFKEQKFSLELDIRRIYADPTHRKNQKEQTYNPGEENNRIKKSLMPNVTLGIDTQQFLERDSIKKYSSAIRKASDQIASRRKSDQERKCTTAISPSKVKEPYLYEKLAGSERTVRDQSNLVYQKRIKSLQQFLWKMMISHNVFTSIDLETEYQSKQVRYKCFIGAGNNCNMIAGLIKRRFWWNIVTELTDDCNFVWTQIKIPRIYQRQESAPDQIFPQNIQHYHENSIQSNKKRIKSSKYSLREAERSKLDSMVDSNKKILNAQDFVLYKRYYEKEEKQTLFDFTQQDLLVDKKIKICSYSEKIKKFDRRYKRIRDINDSEEYYSTKPIVHNHLENNFLLGNKKALLYNLQEYYRLEGQNIFEFIPLTFHIKNGFKDIQYKRFVQFYTQRAKQIKRQEALEEEEGYAKTKMRNIWIVKPGQNSNQGRGIEVIDEIYELDNIIKRQNGKKKGEEESGEQSSGSRTYIVQLYIDRPLLYKDRKFDIRHYVLLTNLHGVLRGYWYEEGYIRTSSYPFNINHFESQIHLTNDAVQKKYPEYGKYEPYNKISYSDFQSYLNNLDRKYNFKEEIIPQMKKMSLDAIRSVYTKITPRNQMHNFQIFGLDFMIDRNFKPWLIEINTNPCLDCTCPLLDRIIPYMVQSSLKLSLDVVYPPPSHYPHTSKHFTPMINLQNFKYELIFDSLMDGDRLKGLYVKAQGNLMGDIGDIDEDETFKENGQQIKLQDFT